MIKKSFKKQNILDIIVGWIILLVFLPVVGNNLPGLFGSIKLATYLFYVAIILIKPKSFKMKFTFYVVLFSLFFHYIGNNTVWYYISAGTITRNIKDYRFMSLGAVLLSYFYNGVKDKAKFGKVTLWALVCIVITCIMTFMATIINPNIVRNVVGGDSGGTELFARYGVGGYGFATVLVLLAPSLAYLHKENFISFRLRLIIQLIFFVTLIRMQIFAAVLTFLAMTVASLGGVKKLTRSIFVTCMMLLILFAIPRTEYANLLEGSAKYFDSSSNIYFKLHDTAQFLRLGEVSDETSAGMKTDRYNMMYEVFSENPILGGFSVPNNNYWHVGYHFYWMFKLASFGLLGSLLFASVHYLYISFSVKLFKESYRFYFLLSCSGLIIMGLLKNLAGREMWLSYFVLLHGIYYIPLTKGNKKTNVQE